MSSSDRCSTSFFRRGSGPKKSSRMYSPLSTTNFWKLPELRHQAGVRIGGETVARRLHAEVLELLVGQTPLEKRPRVYARSSMPLEEHLIAAAGGAFSPEEVVEPDLVERRRGRVGREMSADSVRFLVHPADHRQGVPADDSPDPALDHLVAGEIGLLLRRNRVDVVTRHHWGNAHLARPSVMEEPVHKEAGALRRMVDDLVQRLNPFPGFGGVDVGQLV